MFNFYCCRRAKRGDNSLLWQKSPPSHYFIVSYYIHTRVQKVAFFLGICIVSTRVQKSSIFRGNLLRIYQGPKSSNFLGNLLYRYQVPKSSSFLGNLVRVYQGPKSSNFLGNLIRIYQGPKSIIFLGNLSTQFILGIIFHPVVNPSYKVQSCILASLVDNSVRPPLTFLGRTPLLRLKKIKIDIFASFLRYFGDFGIKCLNNDGN